MNWGYKITLGIISFMTFIIVLVTKMMTTDISDALIEKDYYEKGQAVDTELLHKQNARRDSLVPNFVVTARELKITFPSDVMYEAKMQRLSDAGHDTIFRNNKPENEIVVPASQLAKGSWLIRLNYRRNITQYLHEEKITIP